MEVDQRGEYMILVYAISAILAAIWIWGMVLFVTIFEKIEEKKKNDRK